MQTSIGAIGFFPFGGIVGQVGRKFFGIGSGYNAFFFRSLLFNLRFMGADAFAAASLAATGVAVQ